MIAGTLEIQLLANMARLQKDMDDAKRSVGGAMAAIEKSVDAAKAAFVGLAGAFVAGVSINAFTNIIKGSIDSAAALNDLAIQTGATVEELSGLASVGKFSEQTAQSIGAAMNKLSKNMAGASEESRGTGAALKALGINFESFAKLSPAQQMQEVAGKMAQFADGGGKAAVVMGLYGKSGAALLPMFKDLAVAGELQAKITTEQAAAADDFSDDLIRLRARGEAWKKDLSLALLPALNEFLGTLLKSGGIMQTFSGWVKDLAKSGQLTAWAQAAREGIELLMAAIKPAALILGSWFALFVAAPAIYAAAVAALTPLVHGLALYITNILIGQAATTTWNTALFGTSVAAQLAAGSLSKIGLAASILFAAFAGWQIGTYLREQFVEARVAGLAFVAVMLIGWENVKYAGQLAWEGIKFSFGAAIAIMQGVFAGFLSATAKGLDFIGAGDAAAKMTAYAESLRVSAGAQKTFAEQTAGLTAAHKKEVAAIDDTIADMVRFELATDAASKSAKKLAAVPKPKLPDLLIPDGRDKPAAQASEYDKIIKAIAEKTAVEKLALASAAKLTDGDKYQVKILEDLRLGYLKITPEQQAHIKVQLAAYLQAEQLNAKKAAYIKRIQAEYAEQEQTRAEQGAAQVAIDNARAASRAVVDDYVRAIKEQNEVTYIEIALDKKSSAERSLALGQHRIELELKKQLAAIDASSGFDASDKAENAARVRAAAAAATASLKAQTVLAAAKELDSFLDASRAENFGQALAGAFGKAGKAIADMSGIFSKYAKQQEGFEVARSAAGVAYANDSKQLSAAQEAISKQELASKLGAFGDMANAAKGFFAENSAGYKTMEGVAKVAHTAQLAMNLIEMGQLAVKAVLNQAGGDPYTAWVRMAAMAAAVGALGFAVGGGFNKSSGDQTSAADRQKTQGTGTVLGDASAKSASIENALKLVEANTASQLGYSNSMLNSLKGIERAMVGLASAIFRSAGIVSGNATGVQTGKLSTQTAGQFASANFGFLGKDVQALESIVSGLPILGGLFNSIHNRFGGVKQEITDGGLSLSGTLGGLQSGQGASGYTDVKKTTSSWFGLVKEDEYSRYRNELDGPVKKQIGLVFQGIGDSLLQAGISFGMDGKTLGDKMLATVIDIPSISLRGLKGKELEDALGAVFSGLSDKLAADLVPGFDALVKTGEGYYQTIMRVSTELQSANTWLKAFGNNLFAASVAGGVAADGLVQLFGGLEEFNKSNQNYFKEYYSDAERNAIQTGLLSGELKKLGLAMPTTRDGLRAMIDEASKHLDTESGREFYAQLRAMAPAFAELVPSAEKLIGVLAGLKDTQNDLQGKLLEAQGNAAGAAALKKGLELVKLGEGLSTTERMQVLAAYEQNEALTKQISALEVINNWADKLLDTLKGLEDQDFANQNRILTAQGNTEEVARRTRERDLARMLEGSAGVSAARAALDDAAAKAKNAQTATAPSAALTLSTLAQTPSNNSGGEDYYASFEKTVTSAMFGLIKNTTEEFLSSINGVNAGGDTSDIRSFTGELVGALQANSIEANPAKLQAHIAAQMLSAAIKSPISAPIDEQVLRIRATQPGGIGDPGQTDAQRLAQAYDHTKALEAEATAAEAAAAALKAMSDSFSGTVKSLGSDIFGLEVGLLEAQGQGDKAAALKRERYLLDAGAGQTEANVAAMAALYDRKTALEAEVVATKKAAAAQQALADKYTSAVDNYNATVFGLQNDLLRATGGDVEAARRTRERDLGLQNAAMSDTQKANLAALYDQAEALKAQITAANAATTAAKAAADAVQALADKFNSAKESFKGPIAGLEIDLLKAQGRDAEAASIVRARELLKLGEGQSAADQAALATLYDRAEALRGEVAATNAASAAIQKAKDSAKALADTLAGVFSGLANDRFTLENELLTAQGNTAAVLARTREKFLTDNGKDQTAGDVAAIAARYDYNQSLRDQVAAQNAANAAAQAAADAVQALADKFNSAKESFNGTIAGLEIDLLKAQGRDAEAASIVRARELLKLVEGQSAADQAALATLYDRAEALRGEIAATNEASAAIQKAKDSAKALADTLAGVFSGLANDRFTLENELLTAQGNTAAVLARTREKFLTDNGKDQTAGDVAAIAARYDYNQSLRDQVAAQNAANAAAQAAAQAQQQAADQAASAAKQVADAWRSITDGLYGEVARIRGLVGDSAQSQAQAQYRFSIASAQALAGDQEAGRSLPKLSQDLLGIIESNAGSSLDVQRAQAQIAGRLEGIAGYLSGGAASPYQAIPSAYQTATQPAPTAPNFVPFAAPGQANNAELIFEIKALNARLQNIENYTEGTEAHTRKTKEVLVNVTHGGEAMQTEAV